MLVRCDKGHVTELALQVNPKRFNSVAHAVGCRHAWQILQEMRQSSLVWRFLKILVIRYVTLRLNFSQFFA